MSTGGAGGDAWSAGCVVQELCTLSKAFASRHLTALLRIIVHNQRAPLRPSPYSEELLDVVEGLLLPDLDARLSASTALPRVRSLIAESGACSFDWLAHSILITGKVATKSSGNTANSLYRWTIEGASLPLMLSRPLYMLRYIAMLYLRKG